MKITEENTKEWRILQAVKGVLVRVARETAVPPGTRHTLSPETIDGIRQCMGLISSREMELGGKAEELTSSRPRYPGQSNVTPSVNVEQILRSKPAKN
ncbi:MAG: hypothetical protein ACI9FD_003315 [Gammaproteobacteria bacterium]|jgi:hypothetical protein